MGNAFLVNILLHIKKTFESFIQETSKGSNFNIDYFQALQELFQYFSGDSLIVFGPLADSF